MDNLLAIVECLLVMCLSVIYISSGALACDEKQWRWVHTLNTIY